MSKGRLERIYHIVPQKLPNTLNVFYVTAAVASPSCYVPSEVLYATWSAKYCVKVSKVLSCDGPFVIVKLWLDKKVIDEIKACEQGNQFSTMLLTTPC